MPQPTFHSRPLDLKAVTIEDAFWSPRQRVNRRVALQAEYDQHENTGRHDALRLKWRPGRPKRPHEFWDSDVAKWIEAACYELAVRPNAKLARQIEGLVAAAIAAQRDDGYLNSHFILTGLDARWTNLRDRHELYCAGHLMEAAVAHYHATGRRTLLDALARYADHIARTFGRGRGKKPGYPGHEEIELALAKLARATGESKYLAMAKYFVDERGRQPSFFEAEALARGEDPARTVRGVLKYWQAHQPVREQSEAVGHAVRACYLYSGMADVAGETHDADLLAACRRLWDSIEHRKMYVTGGVGARHHGESFGDDYELPNRTAYAETCAAIALAFFAHRMVQIDPDARYADAMERALCNGALSGISLDGRRFFYVNPLSSDGTHHRQEYFGCACCPPNVSRVLASLGHYVYTAGPRDLWVHLYVAGSAEARLGGQTVRVMQDTRYPWDGRVKLTVHCDAPARFALRLRIPRWCRKWTLSVAGKRTTARPTKGYVRLGRTWADGETVELKLDMPVERIAAHPYVECLAGHVALQRGPIVYCVENCDHATDIRNLVLPDTAKLKPRWLPKLLGGVTVIEGRARARTDGKAGHYRPLADCRTRLVKLRAIPYAFWDNRRGGAMAVWLPRV